MGKPDEAPKTNGHNGLGVSLVSLGGEMLRKRNMLVKGGGKGQDTSTGGTTVAQGLVRRLHCVTYR